MKLVAVVLLLGSMLAADWSVTRRSDVTFDGTKLTLIEGEERDIPCQHSPGKTHHVRVDQAKTYQFNGFGAHFDFDSAMAIHVDAKEAFTLVNVAHPAGPTFIMRVLKSKPEGGVMDHFVTEFLSILHVDQKDVVRTPAKMMLAGEEVEALSVDSSSFSSMKLKVSLRFFWKPIGKGGLVGCFLKGGPTPDAADAAFATIEKSLRFDKE